MNLGMDAVSASRPFAPRRLPTCSGASRVRPLRGPAIAALDPPCARWRLARAGEGRTEPPAGAPGTRSAGSTRITRILVPVHMTRFAGRIERILPLCDAARVLGSRRYSERCNVCLDRGRRPRLHPRTSAPAFGRRPPRAALGGHASRGIASPGPRSERRVCSKLMPSTDDSRRRSDT